MVTFDRLAVDRICIKYSNMSRELADEMKVKREADQFNITARKIIYARHIMAAQWMHDEYNKIYADIHKYEGTPHGLDLLTELIRLLTWKQFLICLEYYVAKRGNMMITMGYSVTKSGVDGVVKKIKGIPQWVGMRK
jgi:hypothetical protein